MSVALDERGVPLGYPFRPDLETTPREVRQAMRTPGGAVRGSPLLVLDVRTPDEFEAAHIPGSVLIPLHELERRADEIDVEKSSPIAVLCHHGGRSLKGALVLRALGFTGAKSVVGGIDLWSRDVDPSIPRYTMGGGRCTRLPAP